MDHSGIAFPDLDSETSTWQQQGSEYLATVADPPRPQPDQIRNALQDDTRRSHTCCQTFQPAAPAPNAIPPLWNSTQANDYDIVSYMSVTDPYHTHDESWPWERPESTARDYIPQDRTSYPQEYAQEPSGFDLLDQHQSTGIVVGQPLGPHAPRRSTGQDGCYRYDSASSWRHGGV